MKLEGLLLLFLLLMGIISDLLFSVFGEQSEANVNTVGLIREVEIEWD